MIIITIVMYIIASVISFTPLFLIRGRNALFLKKMKGAKPPTVYRQLLGQLLLTVLFYHRYTFL